MRYHTAVLLGEGGMGAVYRAFDPVLGRHVALKFLHRDNPALVERLLREARLQARVEHENVCRVYEVGESDGRPYVAMQYIEGRTLDEAAATLTLQEKVRLLREVAEAVHAAHRVGLVHRDLKPGNVMVETREGRLHPFVLDFGLARDTEAPSLTQTGNVLGSPPYMAPEQARGDVRGIDRRTDVYAMGAVLYELLTGRPPFQGGMMDVLVKVVHDDPLPPRRLDPRIPADLETVALKCLEKEPQRRYDSARALAEDLGRFLDGEPVLARRSGILGRVLRRSRRNRAALATAAAGLAVAAVMLGLWLRARWSANTQAEQAQRFGQEVERIEGVLREAYLMPLHDVREERRQLRESMAGIESEMRRIGAPAEGPGRFALGRGAQALGDHESARRFLQQAWNGGYRTPEVELALGRALGALYTDAVEQNNRIAGRDERERKRRDIERDLREPAVLHLKAAAGARGASGETLPALIAYYERRYDDALSLLRQHAARRPLDAEALTLEGRVHVEMGSDAQRRGERAAAEASFARARESLVRAVDVARSNPTTREAVCELEAARVDALGTPSAEGRALVDRAVAACAEASLVSPDRALPWSQQSRALWRWAEVELNAGLDSRATTDRAIAAARRALELDAGDAASWNHLALAVWGRAEEVAEAGDDPRPTYQEAIGAFEKAAALRPAWVSAQNNLGAIYHSLAQWEVPMGIDPAPHVQRAVEAATRAAQLAPELFQPQQTLGTAHWSAAWFAQRHGQDPAPHLAPARAAFEACARIAPASSQCLRGLARCDLTQAEYELARGGDPRASAARAAQHATEAVKLDGESSFAQLLLGQAHVVNADYAAAHGGDVEAALRPARAGLARALQLNRSYGEALVASARLELALARAAQAAGRSPAPHLSAARARADQNARLHPRDPDVLAMQAEVQRRQSEASATRLAAAGGGH